MGEGLYRSPDGHTAYVEIFEDLGLEYDWLEARLRYDALVGAIRGLLSSAWSPVADEWRACGSRVIARNRLHEIWLIEDSYERVHVTFGVRHRLEASEILAWHWLDARAGAFLDALQARYPLRVRTSPWTSTERAMRRAIA